MFILTTNQKVVGSNPAGLTKKIATLYGWLFFLLRIGEESEATNCKGVGKGAECQHSVLSGKAGNEASLLARNEHRASRNLSRRSGHR